VIIRVYAADSTRTIGRADGRPQMYRVIVAITWPSPNCTAGLCQYVAAMLIESTLDDPTWQ
jgi:hypothetical protein